MFLSIPLDIQNKRTLKDALDLMVQKETFEGENKYHCDEHNRKIDATRRSVIGDLGSSVVFSLNRFELNYQTMTRKKINDYLEFPDILDLTPWTKEGLEKAEAAENNSQENSA
jgi:ubiquitin C-terminal hydrolase